jgi:hypothetical protein
VQNVDEAIAAVQMCLNRLETGSQLRLKHPNYPNGAVQAVSLIAEAIASR